MIDLSNPVHRIVAAAQHAALLSKGAENGTEVVSRLPADELAATGYSREELVEAIDQAIQFAREQAKPREDFDYFAWFMNRG